MLFTELFEEEEAMLGSEVLGRVGIVKLGCNKAKRLPPGPSGLPILGSLLKLGANPHRDLHKLASTKTWTHHVPAPRPPQEAAKYISWDQRNLIFAEYGPYWRNMRKMCTLELLSQTKINSFKTTRQEEIDLFIKLVR
ncbi:hypothetical protein PIB30_055057 [Stylosanthes scabra]|uniref:Uncharacterized protein n=1 Tax=Stylosanthes scabra TaxID=79078 RepID=A0ABU6WMC3_9FABA|nr:hypothetical protein [Stylosanthes scabra]